MLLFKDLHCSFFIWPNIRTVSEDIPGFNTLSAVGECQTLQFANLTPT
jgi:hypothetical protein